MAAQIFKAPAEGTPEAQSGDTAAQDYTLLDIIWQLIDGVKINGTPLSSILSDTVFYDLAACSWNGERTVTDNDGNEITLSASYAAFVTITRPLNGKPTGNITRKKAGSTEGGVTYDDYIVDR